MTKAKDDKPHIKYFNMGPWPVYVGATAKPKAFKREMARLCPGRNIDFVGSGHANATTHLLTLDGAMTAIVAIQSHGKHSKEAYAALIAHEVMHVVQYMREHLISSNSACTEGLGIEAEAYIMQYLVQEIISVACDTGRRKRERPISTKE